MSTLSIHPVDYLRGHVRYQAILTRLLTSLGSLVKKVFESSEHSATIAVLLLAVGLVIFSCIIIGQAASFVNDYNGVLAEMVLPPIQAIPTGM